MKEYREIAHVVDKENEMTHFVISRCVGKNWDPDTTFVVPKDKFVQLVQNGMIQYLECDETRGIHCSLTEEEKEFLKKVGMFSDQTQSFWENYFEFDVRFQINDKDLWEDGLSLCISIPAKMFGLWAVEIYMFGDQDKIARLITRLSVVSGISISKIKNAKNFSSCTLMLKDITELQDPCVAKKAKLDCNSFYFVRKNPDVLPKSRLLVKTPNESEISMWIDTVEQINAKIDNDEKTDDVKRISAF